MQYKNKKNSTEKSTALKIVLFLFAFFIILFSLQYFAYDVYAVPVGPTIMEMTNETYSRTGSTLINTTGGSITTMVLNVTAQNLKWKAFVGNVTGRLVLSDASSYSIFDWSLSNIVGTVYATRSPELISWGDISCANKTHIGNEEFAMNHTSNPNDNISATFSSKSHESFHVGTVKIEENECYSIHTNVNNQTQSSHFEEVILYDGTNSNNGDIVYATRIEQAQTGYNTLPYDFQMIVPEMGHPSWTGSTAYYFYVELT